MNGDPEFVPARDDDADGAAAFAVRTAGPLRAPESLPPDFEARLMASVRAEAASLYPPPALHRPRTAAPPAAWWSRPRTLRLSPLAGLALAAGLAGIVCLGTLGVVRAAEALPGRGAPAPQLGMTPDTVHVVRFVLVAPAAHTVALVGDFNGWSRDATTLGRTGASGVWSVSMPLQPGRHEYAFIVDGERWIADPLAATVRDDFGTESSIVTVGGSA